MLLTQKNLSGLVCGGCPVTEENGYISFSRFTKEQTDAFAKNADLLMKTGATAGISLYFQTDARNFSFSYRVEKGSSRPFYTFDLYVNGIFYESQGGDGVPNEGECRFALPDGEKTVELYLPCLAKALLKNVSVDGNVTKPAPRKGILFLGDSITQGYDARNASLCYPARVCRALSMSGWNQGVGAAQFDASTVGTVPFCDPEQIVIAYGTNDWFVGRTDLEQQARAYIAQVRALFPKIPIYVITPIWRADCGNVTPTGTFSDARCMVENACAGIENITVVDGMRLVEHNPRFFGDAFLHPNDEGFAQYAEGLLQAMQ